MPGIDPNLSSHALHIHPTAVPVKQAARFFKPDLELQIKAEIEHLLSAGFIKPIQHPTWLSSIVPVRKKSGAIRVCVDFRDLNKACPKDDYPLPNIDTLVDATAEHEMYSFMDGYVGYNQIKMAVHDAEHTAFRTPLGNFYYTVMPFGLKNAGATYQRTMMAIFHDMFHHNMEFYVDDLVVKSKKEIDHFKDLQMVFERCRKYQLRMNPMKCVFGVTRGKFLGFVVNRHGVAIDEDKKRAIMEMERPKTQKQLKSFLGRISYLRRFIPALAEISHPLSPLLRNNVSFKWSEDHQLAFDNIKKVLSSASTMCPPKQGQPLLLYLTSTINSVGALLAQEVQGVEKPVYYLSRIVSPTEKRYTPIERHCLALVFVAQKLRHYLLAFSVHIITKCDPIRYLLSKTVLMGRAARWFLILTEYELLCIAPKAIKSQALADLLANFPSGHFEPSLDELPADNLESHHAEEEWILEFDGSSITKEGGAGIILVGGNKRIALSYKLDFPCSNNEAEYEALILGLLEALNRGVRYLCIKGDSNLVIRQAEGEFAIKHIHLAPYRVLVQKLCKQFARVRFEKLTRTANRHTDALATIATKIAMTEGQDSTTLTVLRRTTPVSITNLVPRENLNDWRTEIEQQFEDAQAQKNLSILRKYTMLRGILYYRDSSGLLARCVGSEEAQQILKDVHEATCGMTDIALYRRIQRMGYFWPTMKAEASKLQQNCQTCQEFLDKFEATFLEEELDWRQPYITYLQNNVLPEDPQAAAALRKRAHRFTIFEGQLFRRWYNGNPLRCLAG